MIGAVALREDQIRRYARHVLLPDVGGRGQERLLAASVAVEVGPGRAAECAALAYLAAAGVGRLVLAGAAGDPVTAGEIATGVLYGAADHGRPRLEALRERIRRLNPDVEVVAGGDAALRLADELPPDDTGPAAGAAADPDLDAGLAIADALVRGGAAATRVLVRAARAER